VEGEEDRPNLWSAMGGVSGWAKSFRTDESVGIINLWFAIFLRSHEFWKSVNGNNDKNDCN